MTRDERSEPRALQELTALLRDAPAAPTQAELDRGLTALRARLSSPRGGRSVGRTWIGAAAVLALCGALAVTWWRSESLPTGDKSIAVTRIEGGQLLQGGYLSESGSQGVRLFFDEGSDCAVSPGGRGRLRLDARTGARLLLERGSASLRITPTREPRWTVESGPFLVTVKGTDFTVAWDPSSERFDLTLRRGRVVVSGPLVGDDFSVRPGQKLSVSLPRGETLITEERKGAPAAPADASSAPAAPAPSVAPAAGAEVTPTSPTPAPPPSAAAPRQWRAALANGEWDRILTEAERGGIEATLERASSDDLFALADAARYRRRASLAESALLAQRRRFPSSPRGPEAIFLLGRVAELRPSGRATALERYEEYLARAPAGTFAAEALGRKMTLMNELGGQASARSAAESYLRRFPNGSYAGAAKALLSVGE